MHKKSLVFSLLSIALFSFSCEPNAKQQKEAKQKILDYGKIENGVYTNEFFNFSLELPQDWHVQSQESMEDLQDAGSDLLAGEDENKKAILEASRDRSGSLLGLFKYEIGSQVDFNPSFLMLFERFSGATGIKTGADYLFHTRKMLKESNLSYAVLDEEFKSQQVDGRDFYTLNTRLDVGENSIYQTYYVHVEGKYALAMIMTYFNPETKTELEAILNKVKFGQD